MRFKETWADFEWLGSKPITRRELICEFSWLKIIIDNLKKTEKLFKIKLKKKFLLINMHQSTSSMQLTHIPRKFRLMQKPVIHDNFQPILPIHLQSSQELQHIRRITLNQKRKINNNSLICSRKRRFMQFPN